MKVEMSGKQAASGQAPQQPSEEGQRLSKRVMQQKGCSRSVAEQYVEGGWVSVDGEIQEEPGLRVRDEQVVAIAADASLLDLAPVTFVLNQPAKCKDPFALLSVEAHSATDPQSGRMRVLRRHFKGLYECAPLHRSASGLAVFTQDRNIARRLYEDAASLEHECIVEVTGDAASADLASLRSGAVLPPAKVSRQNENHLRFALAGTAMNSIGALCTSVGLKAVSIRRIRIGRVPLSKLPEGEWRFLGLGERF